MLSRIANKYAVIIGSKNVVILDDDAVIIESKNVVIKSTDRFDIKSFMLHFFYFPFFSFKKIQNHLLFPQDRFYSHYLFC